MRIYSHASGVEHDTGPGHPECADRLRALWALFTAHGWPVHNAPQAELAWVARCHDRRYIDRLIDSVPDAGYVALDGDTILSSGSLDAALDAAGTVCQAVTDIAAGKSERAFCAIRPPGHHAEPDGAMGFCLFNNVFVGALHAQSLGFGRVAIVDFDVHHGNGSDTMARQHEGIFYISTHQWPLFPGTGGPDDQMPGRLLNIPLPAGTDGATFRRVYRDRVFPALRDFAPDLLMISAGFDGHRDDPLAQFLLEADDFGWVTGELRQIQPRIVSVLEGGYNIAALTASAAAHLIQLQ